VALLHETGIRILIFILCANRLITYYLVTQISVLRKPADLTSG
jgi:hypothetical protein